LCLKRVPLERRLRLLGVRVGGLVRLDEETATNPAEVSTSPGPRTADLF
jgi:DNA polymerase-4